MIEPYISRSQDEQFFADIRAALEQPQSCPLMFQAWGVGGVGKTTLLRKVEEQHPEAAIALVRFGETTNIDSPLPLMETLMAEVNERFGNDWPDVFTERYHEYRTAIEAIKTQPADGKSPNDFEAVQAIVKAGTSAAQGALSVASAKPVEAIAKGGEMLSSIITIVEKAKQLLQQHPATKNDPELRELLCDPLPKLTELFAQSLIARSQQCPVLLLLDTYEKVPLEVDSWLCRSLLGNHPELQAARVRMGVVGRARLLNQESWRKLHQDQRLLREYCLNKFDEPKTQDYLAQIGIIEAAEVSRIYRVTRGLPYYLNWIRERQLCGNPIDFSEGNAEIVNLLLQGLSDEQKQVIECVACCLWFDQQTVRYLLSQVKLEQQPIDFKTAADSLNWFDWLTRKTFFVERVQQRYRLDDVARDVFRQSLWNRDRGKTFRQVCSILAADCQEQADDAVSRGALPTLRYGNEAWRQAQAEALYYKLLARQPEIQKQFLACLLEARYLGQDIVVQLPYGWLKTDESEIASHPYLSEETRQFLSQIMPAIEHSWAVLAEDPIDYEYNLVRFGLSKSAVDQAIQSCLAAPTIETLEGLAKYAALFYKSKRCLETQKLDWLLRAKIQAEQIATPIDIEFSSGMFLWDIGKSLGDLGRYKEAIDSFDKALDFKPDDHYAWHKRSLCLGDLGRYEEAIDSFDKVIAIKPDYDSAFYCKALCYGLQNQVELAVDCLQQAIELDSQYKERAKTDTDFDLIRGSDRFQALIEH